MPRARRVVGLALAGLLAGCADGPSFGAPDAATEEGAEIVDLWRGFFYTAIVVFVLVVGLVTYVLIRYRRRDPDEVPRQHADNLRIEILYTAAPILVVAILFGFTVAAEERVSDVDGDAAVTVEVVGFQWQWQFRYEDPQGGPGPVVTGRPAGDPPEMVLPVGRTTRLRLVTRDVNHSFWVPRFLSKRDLIPGVRNQIDVTPNTRGSFVGRCAEFCGLDHWRMNFSVRVVSRADYDRWLADQGTGGS